LSIHLSVRSFTFGFHSITPKGIILSTSNLVCDLPRRKERTLFWGVGQGQWSRLLKIEILFPQHNSRRYYTINPKHGKWLDHQKRRILLNWSHVSQVQRSRLLKIVISFPQRNSRRYAINSKLDMRPAHKERILLVVDHVSQDQRSRSLVIEISFL